MICRIDRRPCRGGDCLGCRLRPEVERRGGGWKYATPRPLLNWPSNRDFGPICDQSDLCGPALLAEFLPLRLVGLHCFVTSRLRSIDPGPRSTASPGERE